MDGGSPFQLIYFPLGTLSRHLIKAFPEVEMPSGANTLSQVERESFCKEAWPCACLQDTEGPPETAGKVCKDKLGHPSVDFSVEQWQMAGSWRVTDALHFNHSPPEGHSPLLAFCSAYVCFPQISFTLEHALLGSFKVILPCGWA